MTEHEKRIREALGDAEAADFPFADARATDIRALLSDLDAMRGALEECKRWHQGDKWRNGDSTQCAAWEGQLAVIDAALKGASA